MEAGHWQQAEELLNKAVIGAPDDASSRRWLAEAMWHRDAHQAAVSQMEQAVACDKRNAELRVRAGEMALATGATEVALNHAEKAIGRDPTSAPAWALRGRCFAQLGQNERALADLQHSLKFDSGRSDVLLDVANIYRQRGLPERSLTVLHRLLDTYSSGNEPREVLIQEGLVLLELNRPEQARDAFLAANQRGQPTADELCFLARAYAAANQPQQALHCANQALTLDSGHQAGRQLVTHLAAQASANNAERR